MEIKEMGYKDVLISPLNGDLWVIASKFKQTMVKLIMEDDLWIREWLKDWHSWSFEDGIRETYTWIGITCIPLKFWNEAFIQWLFADEEILVEIDPNIKKQMETRCCPSENSYN